MFFTDLFNKKKEEEHKSYLSCSYIEHGMNVDYDCVRLCCFSCHEGGGRQVLIDNYNGEKINWKKFFKEKSKMRKDASKGKLPEKCKGCFFLKEKEWNKEDYLSYVVFNHWTKCNCKCTYCFTTGRTEYFCERKNFSMLPAVKELVKMGKIKGGGEIGFGGGEPTLLDEFEPLINLLLDAGCDNIRVHSSGIKYSQAMERGLKEGKLTLIISVDSAYKETYEKVKRVPCYDAVWENIKKYAAAQGENKYKMKTKYIIIPGVNDTMQEYKDWIDKSYEIGIRSVIFDLEDFWYRHNKDNVPQHIYDMFDYGKEYTKTLGMQNVEIYDRGQDLLLHRNEYNK